MFVHTPRSSEGTPRTLGETFFVLMAISALSVILMDVSLWLGLGLASLWGGLMLLTSKFALQALLFICIPAAVLGNSSDLFLFPFLIVLTAIFISYGKYVDILKLQLAHLNNYARITQKVMPHMRDRNNPIRIAKKAKDIWREKQYPRLLAILARDITPTAILFNAPHFVFALFIMLDFIGPWQAPPGLDHSLFRTWFWAALFPMIITSFYPFLFLGEAERYHDYSLFPQYIFITAFLWAYDACFWLLLIQLSIYLFYSRMLVLKFGKAELQNSELEGMTEFIDNNYANIPSILILNESSHRLMYYIKNRNVFPDSFNLSGSRIKCFYKFPFLHPDKIGQFVKEQNAGLIIVERLALKGMAEKHNKPYDLSAWPKEVFSNELYMVLET